jgi:NTP pyrophosphatase (non-canonical NTP hydrolase)
MKEMIEAVQRVHRERQFAEQGGEDIFFRMSLMMEELGEVCQCLTKGYGSVGEEHADILILLLGNCIALGIDIESEFWAKINKISKYKTRSMNGRTRLISSAKHNSRVRGK